MSELAWLTEDVPGSAREFFASAYLDMQPSTRNAALVEQAGYDVLCTRTLFRRAWTGGYYDLLGPRARALADHADEGVRQFARETLTEIDVFEAAHGSYGYVFYVLQRR